MQFSHFGFGPMGVISCSKSSWSCNHLLHQSGEEIPDSSGAPWLYFRLLQVIWLPWPMPSHLEIRESIGHHYNSLFVILLQLFVTPGKSVWSKSVLDGICLIFIWKVFCIPLVMAFGTIFWSIDINNPGALNWTCLSFLHLCRVLLKNVWIYR